MKAESFLDTNVLVYAIDATEGHAAKRKAARELIAVADFGLSAQVLQEFYVTVTRKLAEPVKPAEAMAYLDQYAVFPMVLVDPGLVIEGARNSLKYQVSYWDGTIIAAAERLGCRILYSEDLGHGQRYGSVEVVNPFS